MAEKEYVKRLQCLHRARANSSRRLQLQNCANLAVMQEAACRKVPQVLRYVPLQHSSCDPCSSWGCPSGFPASLPMPVPVPVPVPEPESQSEPIPVYSSSDDTRSCDARRRCQHTLIPKHDNRALQLQAIESMTWWWLVQERKQRSWSMSPPVPQSANPP